MAEMMGSGAGLFDYDGDGDLYLPSFGSNQLWRNDGGTFTDVTESSGTDDRRWSTAATWMDYDQDGLLDLFVGNYVDFNLATHKECYAESGVLDYCGPLAYDPASIRSRSTPTIATPISIS